MIGYVFRRIINAGLYAVKGVLGCRYIGKKVVRVDYMNDIVHCMVTKQ